MPESSHPSPLRIVRAAEVLPQPWKNGAGTTREIACAPATGDWQWRLSIADVDAPAPFSAFPGVERELVLLHGEGIRLWFEDDGSTHDLLPPHGRLRFAGERPLHGEPIAGATRDFNLMWRRDAVQAELWHRPLVGTLALFAEPGETWALHLLAGRVQVDAPQPLRLAAGDTLLVDAGAQRIHQRMDGQGEALLIRLRPHTVPGEG